jgi:CheY-like chemotaxis protein
MRILLAEDNPVNQMVLSLMLQKLGHTVTVASDGKQAFSLLSEQPFDLAVMDMQMPVIDGDEVTRRLRRLSGGTGLTYVVALTAAATPEQQQQYRDAGVDAIYTKPIDMDRLRQMLEREGPAALARSGARVAARGV